MNSKQIKQVNHLSLSGQIERMSNNVNEIDFEEH